jgi:hypothetical protein
MVQLESPFEDITTMTRYFLRLRDGDTLFPDDGESQDFATIEEIRREANESARQILSEAARNGKAGSLRQQIEVSDEAGKTILIVPVGHVVGTECQS